jgi:putative FmdB family regulatory protein
MPTYEYECEECGHRFEEFQSMSDKPIDRCPSCSGRVRRLIGAGSAVLFKGRGFYETDYRRRGGASGTRCDRSHPCCGREQPCDTPPCKE